MLRLARSKLAWNATVAAELRASLIEAIKTLGE
jgi:hypothetical protein